VPCPASTGATVLRSHWNYIIKPCGTRKARMCYDGSKRAAPQLRFAQTYVSCIDQPCMRLFFALSTAMGFVVMRADCTNAYTNSPSPTQATYVRMDDANADLDTENELTALRYYRCSRPCMETPKPVLCGKSTSTRLSTISISYTPHTSAVSTEVRSTERSSFYADKSTISLSFVPILLWRKV
jgi:hypothetical protein